MNELKALKVEIKTLKESIFSDKKIKAEDRLNRLYALDQVISKIDEWVLPVE